MAEGMSSLLGLNVTAPADLSELLPIQDVDLDRCQLLGPVALIVQGIMGVIIVAGLVIKRMREQPRRKWKIWLADVGKQVVGQFAVHLSNVAISDLIASTRSDNPCSLFALNILIDTTLGVLLIYFLLQYSTTLMQRYQPHYKTGYYGNPFSFALWTEQAAVYVSCLAVMKILVLVIFWIAPELEDGMSWGLSWIENEEAQVVVVMLILPLVMNLFQFLIVDSIIRSKDPASPSVINQNSDEESLRRGFLETGSDDEDEDGSPEQHRPSRRGSARTSDQGDEYLDLAGGDEDDNGKQKQATELHFDADSPMVSNPSRFEHHDHHSYPPLATANQTALPPYSTLPPPGSVPTLNRAQTNNLEYRDGKEQTRQDEEDDGWGENWSASSDVEEEHLKPIPLRPQQSSVAPLPSQPTATSNASPSVQGPATTASNPSADRASLSKREDEINVTDDVDDDWGFDDSMTSPPRPASASLDLPPASPPRFKVIPPEEASIETRGQSGVTAESASGVPEVDDGVEEDDDGNDWGFDDSLSSPASPIPPPLPDTTQAVKKALGVDGAQLESQQSTIKAPAEVGKELDGLS